MMMVVVVVVMVMVMMMNRVNMSPDVWQNAKCNDIR